MTQSPKYRRAARAATAAIALLASAGCAPHVGTYSPPTPDRWERPHVAKKAPHSIRRRVAAKTVPVPRPRPVEPAPATAARPAMLGQHGKWRAYAGMRDGTVKFCYAVTTPSPPAPRQGAVLFVTHSPPHVWSSVSTRTGYPFKADSEAIIEVGGARFRLLTFTDHPMSARAQPRQRAGLVEAMRTNHTLTVTGTSADGTEVTDQYSTDGFAKALELVDQECPRPGS